MTTPLNIKGRISTIDGFRSIAVLFVIVYHYYCRFSPPISPVNFLPYQYEPITIVKYGYYGVNFFFIISGFVISHTLVNCTSFKEFMARRLIRLMPALIACSLLSFFIIRWFYREPPFEVPSSFLDFLPGLTFLPPDAWNFILNRADISYVDGVYWSLSVEMLFYSVGGFLFFLQPQLFLTNWLKLTSGFLLIRILTSPKTHFLFPSAAYPFLDEVYHLYIILNISYWVYFAIGIFFYSLYSTKDKISATDYLLTGILVLSEFYFLSGMVLKMLFAGVIALFLIFIYRDKWLSFLRHRTVLWLGAISYPVYLLHENIGLMLMNRISDLFNSEGLNKYMPLFSIAIILLVSDMVYKFVEKPVMTFLRARLSFRRASGTEIISPKR